MTTSDPTIKHMTAKYPGRCHVCEQPIAVGTPIVYSIITRYAIHETCSTSPMPNPQPKAPFRRKPTIRLTPDIEGVIEDYLNNTVGLGHVRSQIAWEKAGRAQWNGPEHQAALQELTDAEVLPLIERVRRDQY